MSSNSIYIVYHITYYGNKLPSKDNSNTFPSNYIGSTSKNQIESGYMGSVASKQYKSIWKQELKDHPDLFHLEIISYHDTRSDATWKELQIQKVFNVVKNPLFVNLSLARANGYFGYSDNSKRGPSPTKGRTSPKKGKTYGKQKNPSLLPSKLKGIKTNKPSWNSGLIGYREGITSPRKGKTYGTQINPGIRSKRGPSPKFFTLISSKKSYDKANAKRNFPELFV